MPELGNVDNQLHGHHVVILHTHFHGRQDTVVVLGEVPHARHVQLHGFVGGEVEPVEEGGRSFTQFRLAVAAPVVMKEVAFVVVAVMSEYVYCRRINPR